MLGNLANLKSFSLGLILAALSTAACSPQNSFTETAAPEDSATGIIGGNKVSSSNEIAKKVALMIGLNQDGRQYSCTVSLLSDSIALTAAHCVDGVRQAYLSFSTNVKVQTRSQLRVVDRAIAHPQYKQTMKILAGLAADADADASVKDWGDIALLRFQGGLPKGYSPVGLLQNDSILIKGLQVVLAGYGWIDGVKQTSTDALRMVAMPIYDAQFSKTEVAFDQRVGKGACHGDSGGPAYVKVSGQVLLMGVTSRGNTADCTEFSRYTKVSSYLDWISSTSKLLLAAK